MLAASMSWTRTFAGALSGRCKAVSRLLLIVAVTAVAMAGLYFGFSRSSRLTQEPEIGGPVAERTAEAPPATAPTPPTAAAPLPPPASTSAQPAGSDGATQSGVAPANAFALSIANGRPRAPDVLRVRQGARVTLTIVSDRAGTLEVHGYRQQVKLEANAPVVLAFVAARSGRFGVDVHEQNGGHIEVTALEVQPN